MEKFNVPTHEEVNPENQAIFENLKKSLGMVPNLYATMAHSNTALSNYLNFQNGKTSFSNKEKEVINLVVSQYNSCNYCLSAHTAIGKMNGFTDDEIMAIRANSISFNDKYKALANFALSIASTKGNPDQNALNAFFEAGYDKGNLVDLIIAIADKIVMNYLHNVTQVPIDFPQASLLEQPA